MRNAVAFRRSLAVFLLATCLQAGQGLAAECAGQSNSTCDDGSPCATAADCPGQINCTSNCFRGTGSSTSECLVQLLGARLDSPSDDGPGHPVPKKEIRCTDGDVCDADGQVNNRCSFTLRTCLGNVEEAGACVPAVPVSAVSVKNKTGAKADAALANLQTRARLLLPASSAVCADPVTITVPVRTSDCTRFKSGKTKISLSALAGAEQVQDSDKLKITCAPAASAACAGIRGHVMDKGGAPIAGATVAAGARSVETGVDGGFELPVVENGRVVLHVSRSGYLPAVKRVDVSSGDPSSTSIVMLPSPFPFSVEAAAGGTAADPGGTSLAIPADAFVDSSGQPLPPGAVVAVTIVPIDPSTKQIRAFPGSFDAIGAGGEAEVLQTVSLAEISASFNGETLQLAHGKTAQLDLVIPASAINPATQLSFAAGDAVPMYWLNPSTAVWEREGTGIVAACSQSPARLCVQAQISHFSWWNADYKIDVTCLRGKVVDSIGDPIAGAEVSSIGIDYMSNLTSRTDSAGDYCVLARIESSVRVEAEVTLFGIVTTSSSPPVSTPALMGSCDVPSSCAPMDDLVVPLDRTCITGRVVSPDLVPVSGAKVKGRSSALAITGDDGRFCTAAASDSEVVLAAAGKGTLWASVTVLTGNSGDSCEILPSNCADAGDVVLDSGGCSDGGYLTGTWHLFASTDEFPVVEDADTRRMRMLLGIDSPYVFEVSFGREGRILDFPLDLEGYVQDCDTILLDSPGQPRQSLTRSSRDVCGDGTVNGSDECDDGNASDADGCARARCEMEYVTPGLPALRWQCEWCVSRPVGCGDGAVGAGEQCDDGNIAGYDLCLPDCTLPTCGNGRIDRCEGALSLGQCTSIEECDEGAGNSDSVPGACRTNCRRAWCGDGVLDSGENCDDGNAAGGDGCSAACQSE